MVDQSYSERQLFEKAYERILAEFQIVLNVSLEDTPKIRQSLKRNLDGQVKTAPLTSKPTSSNYQLKNLYLNQKFQRKNKKTLLTRKSL